MKRRSQSPFPEKQNQFYSSREKEGSGKHVRRIQNGEEDWKRAVLGGNLPEERNSWRQAGFSVLMIAFVILAFIVAGSLFLRQQGEIRRVEKREGELKMQYDEVVQESRKIQEDVKRVLSTEEVEQLAREELGYVRPGEIVYKDRGQQNP